MSPGFVPTPTDRYDYYPDPYGARTVSWAVAQAATGTQVELDLQDVYDWQALIFQTDGNGAAANAGVYTVAWFADPQGTLPFGTDTIVVGVAMDAYVVLPIRAPWVKVTSASITGAGTHVAGGRWNVSSLPPAALHMPTVLLGLNGVSVAASTTRTDTIASIRSGPATASFSMPGSAANGTQTIQATAPDNTTRFLAQNHGVAGDPAKSCTLWLPPWPIQVQSQNADSAGAHGVSSSLIVA